MKSSFADELIPCPCNCPRAIECRTVVITVSLMWLANIPLFMWAGRAP